MVKRGKNLHKLSALASEARSHMGRTDWAEKERKAPNDPRIKKYVFIEGKPKCNLFVCDMLYNSGITPPLTSDGKWPIPAIDWTYAVTGWKKVNSMEAGDIVSNGSHVGIAQDGTWTIAAGTHRVYRDNDIKGTIQRWEGDIDD